MSGAAVTAWGYYNSVMLLETVVLSVGAGLIATFDVDTPLAKWFGYQVVMGAGHPSGGFRLGVSRTIIFL